MSALKTWRTKEEVLRDLAEATGRRVSNLDEEYLVVGERPPPRRPIEEDDEMSLLFGGLMNRKHVQGDSSPDLDGITEMLRMVNGYDGEEESNDKGLVNPADTIITISKATKLNPNVQEFVPKHAIDSTSPKKTLDHGKQKSTKTEEMNTGEINRDIQNNTDVTVPNVNNVESDKFKVLTEKLKKQISDSSKSDSLENKRQKNVAIATLLKLYAAKAPTSTTQNKTSDPINAVKLMTPEDFQGTVSIPKENILTTENPSTDTLNSLSIVSENNSKCNNTSTSTPVQHKSPVRNPAISPEIKASIDKVSKWLEEPAQKKSPTVFSSPVGFKRKETKAAKSPVTNGHKILKPNSTEQYKPSTYARDLSKQYVERNKTKNRQRNMWSDLEDILKEKDLEIKQRLEKESLNNQGTNSD